MRCQCGSGVTAQDVYLCVSVYMHVWLSVCMAFGQRCHVGVFCSFSSNFNVMCVSKLKFKQFYPKTVNLLFIKLFCFIILCLLMLCLCFCL